MTNHKLQSVSQSVRRSVSQFLCWIDKRLKKSTLIPNIHKHGLDVWRYVTCGKGVASEKDDLIRFRYLPEDWWYCINSDGEGVAVDFPLKARPVLSRSQQKFTVKDGKLVKAARFPIEKVCLTLIWKACNTANIL